MANDDLVGEDGRRTLGRNVPTERCLQAMQELLRAHAALGGGLDRFGLDEAWAERLRIRARRMLELEAQRLEQVAALRVDTRYREHLTAEAQLLWQRLCLAGRMALLPRPPCRGRAPRREAALLGGLREACAALDEPALGAPLQRCGFGAAERAQLGEVLAALQPLDQELRAQRRACAETSRALGAVRGALLLDLRRLSQIARRTVGPRLAQGLELSRRLRAPARRRRPAAP